ncbi:hypothetical protein ACVIOG_004313 [Rhizobium leguminosarum]
MLISDIPSMGGEETAAHASSAVRRIGRVKDALSLRPTHTPPKIVPIFEVMRWSRQRT